MADQPWIFATILQPAVEGRGNDEVAILTIPPGPVAHGDMQAALQGMVSDVQLRQIHAGFRAVRQAYSSELARQLVLRRLSQQDLLRTDVFPQADLKRLKAGGAIVSLAFPLDVQQ
jgi:hypothetical protein